MLKFLTHVADIAPGCEGGGLFGFPPWFKYLDVVKNTDPATNQVSCDVMLGGLSDVWKVAAAILEILLRVGGLVAAAFIIYGGIKLAMAQGEPDRIKSGKDTIINAVVGLVIAVLAATIVSIIAGRLS